jgi:PAS domain S-box-containing protein
LTTSIIERGRAEQRFRVFLSSPDAMVVSHLHDGRIIEVNERWEKSFGFPARKPLVGPPATLIFILRKRIAKTLACMRRVPVTISNYPCAPKPGTCATSDFG